MSARKLRDAEDARRCLEQAESSGLTRTEWAHAHGVDARSLNAWHLNLERGRHREECSAVRLVEWVVSEPLVEEPVRYVVRCGELAVEVDDRFDGEVLRRLLAVVSSC